MNSLEIARRILDLVERAKQASGDGEQWEEERKKLEAEIAKIVQDYDE